MCDIGRIRQREEEGKQAHENMQKASSLKCDTWNAESMEKGKLEEKSLVFVPTLVSFRSSIFIQSLHSNNSPESGVSGSQLVDSILFSQPRSPERHTYRPEGYRESV